jgi:NADPH:quinone reductase-like Zn-dependent oxidoreductase
MTGIVGNQWALKEFGPMQSIPTAVYLTSYAGEAPDFMAMPFNELVAQVKDGSLPVEVGKVFRLEQMVEAHRTMDANSAGGKIVVLT